MSYESLIKLLAAIPIRGWQSTAGIHNSAAASGHVVARRTIERALANLADQPFPPIECRGGDSPGMAKEWRWIPDHPLQRPARRESLLIETLLLHRMARQLMPPEIAQRLDEEERSARSDLAKTPDTNAAWWLDHVIALPPGPRRYPKALEPGVYESVSAALWKRRQLKVEYRSRGQTRWKEMLLHPHGLVQDGYMPYLVATVFGYDDVRHLSLARMRKAEELPAPSRVLEGFDFRAHVAAKFDWPYDETKAIEFWIHKDRMVELDELPISKDQQIEPTPNEDGYHRVTATVTPSYRLDTFLMSFGDEVIREDEDE